MDPELNFIEMLFICWLIFGAFLLGYSIIQLLGLMVVKVWDRKKRKHRWTIVRRVL